MLMVREIYMDVNTDMNIDFDKDTDLNMDTKYWNGNGTDTNTSIILSNQFTITGMCTITCYSKYGVSKGKTTDVEKCSFQT